jgi:hypothetical protein
VIAHRNSFIFAIPLEFTLKRRTSIDRRGAFVMCSQVLTRSCQEVRPTLSMTAVHWHVEPLWRCAKI